jgi:nucleoside-triphosphatase THEP1
MMTQTSPPESKLMIVTGWRNTGKTTFCQFMIEAARERNLKVSGLLSPGVFENYDKIRIEMEDLSSGEKRVLAHKGFDPESEFNLPHWVFEKENLTWGNTVFEKSVPTDVLIVDELGPIELEQNKGWTFGMQALDSGQYKVAIVVIRPELMPLAKQRWPQGQTITLQSVNLVPSLTTEIIRECFPNS